MPILLIFFPCMFHQQKQQWAQIGFLSPPPEKVGLIKTVWPSLPIFHKLKLSLIGGEQIHRNNCMGSWRVELSTSYWYSSMLGRSIPLCFYQHISSSRIGRISSRLNKQINSSFSSCFLSLVPLLLVPKCDFSDVDTHYRSAVFTQSTSQSKRKYFLLYYMDLGPVSWKTDTPR